MKQLAALAEQGLLAPIDVEFGTLLQRRAAARLSSIDEVRVVGLTGALLSAERGRGHSCIDLAQLAGTSPWSDAIGPMLPDAATWRAILERSGACSSGECLAPLVLEGDRLYLYRFHAAERRLAAAVRSRLIAKVDPAPPDEGTVALLRKLFPAAGGTDWQAVAAAAALRNRLTVVTGGPGTGKTTTVARILALLLQREPTLRIALAAPTGKAAARLVESIRANADKLPIDDAARAALPVEGHTLHRLLGYQPWNDGFRHGPDQPLADDVIVVDEASMVDLLMMDALFAAARPSARIILLGDPDQLASVDTGYVLGDVCRAADDCGASHGAELARWFERLSGAKLEPHPERSEGPSSSLRDAVVRLHRSYRFERQPGIGALATAVRAGDSAAALAALADEKLADVRRRDAVPTIAELVAPVVEAMDAYLDAGDPAEALARLSAFRVLCALREGPAGVAGLNDAIERWLRGRGPPTRARWYRGRPVLVTANDPATGLFNGDVGVTFEVGGRMQVWFPDAKLGARAVATTRLPAHETAWAMTVHKAQGSEFEHVLLVLPGEDHRVLTRELLYTGVTRARTSVDVVGTDAVLAAAIARTTTRASGLSELLSSRGNAARRQ